MKQLITVFYFLFFFVAQLTAQSLITAEGNAYLSNWTPAQNNNKFEPTIGNMTVKYRFEPDSLQCKVQMSMQWYLGNAVHNNGEIHKYPIIGQTEIASYSITDLEIQADVHSGNQFVGQIFFNMGRTPQAGGLWGDNKSETRSWGTLMQGVSSLVAKNAFNSVISLKNLKIRRITFGGEYQFKQLAYQKYVNQAREDENQKQWENALKHYQIAKKMIPTDNFVNTKIQSLEQKLAKFQQFLQLGDQAYDNKEYIKALTAYKNANNEVAGQEHPQSRIIALEKRLQDYADLKTAAGKAFQEAKNVNELIAAKQKFADALALLPLEKKGEIEAETQKIDQLLESEYKHALQEAKLAYDHQEYAYAAQHYRTALEIFPNQTDTRQKLDACATPLKQKLTQTYQDSLQETKAWQAEKLALAAQALNQQNESCHLQGYTRNQCLENYYTAVNKTIDLEVRHLVYANTTFNKTPMNCQAINCQINPLLETNSQSASAYLLAAKRKHQHFARYRFADFQKFRDQFIEQALTLNPQYVDAFLFKAEIAESITDKMLWYHKVIEIQPNHVQAKQALDRLEGQFMGELFTFVDKNRIDELHKALDLGLLKKSGNYKGQNIVQYVISKDNAPMLALLLDKRHQLANTINSAPNSLLYYAVERKATNCVEELLINHAADPNYKVVNKEALLIQAANKKYSLIASYLLEKGADPYIANRSGKTALMIALENGDQKIVDALLKKYDITKIKNEEVFTAVRTGNTPIVSQLLNKGVDVNMKNDRGQSLIHLAILGQSAEMSEAIINYGADLEARDREGNTALLLASKQAKSQIAKLLITKDARINIKNNSGEMPLYLAIKNDLQDVVRELIQKNAQVDAVFEITKIRNETSLGNRMAKALVIHGIETNEITLVKQALKYRPKVGFLAANAYPNVLRKAAKKNRVDLFLLLIDNQANTKLEPEGLSALHIAIDEKNEVLTQQLLEKSIGRNTLTNTGVNPFHFAARVGFTQGLTLLLKYYDIDMQDDRKNTALHYAVEGDQPEMIRELLSKGANPKIKNENRWNPKKMAKKTQEEAFKEILLV